MKMLINKANRLQKVKEYYFSTKLKEINSLMEKGRPIINLGVGSPDLSPPKEVIQAISKTVVEKDKHTYQNYRGLPKLRESIVQFYKNQYKVTLKPQEEVLPLMGSKEGILHISMAFLNKGDAVLIPNPGYMTYVSVTNLIEAKPVFYDLTEGDWLPDLNKLAQLDLSKVKLMWLNYPNMPTGSVANKFFFEKLIAFAKKHQILLVNDNPYSFILNEREPLSILSIEGAKEVALELNSLSKSFNIAGWRVGMLLGHSNYIDAVLQVKSNMDSGMFYGIQKGAIAALQLNDTWFTSLNSIYRKRRKIVWKILDKLHCTYKKSSVGLFVWAKIPEDMQSELLVDNLLHNKDIFMTPGTIFGSNGEGYIRVSLCVSEENLIEVLNRLQS